MVEQRANQPQKVLPLAPRERQVFDFVKKRYRQTRGKTLVPQVLIAEGLGIKKGR